MLKRLREDDERMETKLYRTSKTLQVNNAVFVVVLFWLASRIQGQGRAKMELFCLFV